MISRGFKASIQWTEKTTNEGICLNNNFISNYVSTHYQLLAASTEAVYLKRLYVWKSYLLPYLPKQKDSAILEIGSGVGHNLYALQDFGIHKYQRH